MQIELIGGSRRHPDIQKIHTGIEYVRAKGKPVYNFVPDVRSGDPAAGKGANDNEDPINIETSITKEPNLVSPSSARAALSTALPAKSPHSVVLKYVLQDP